jgi:putative membrane protein insertion efficiency factor
MQNLTQPLRLVVKAPIHAYRYAISPLIGPRCRHMPSCSEYALNAIDINGAWAGFWLTCGRICRCHPLGTSGYDPAPDLRSAHVPFWTPWRYILLGLSHFRRIPQG